MRSSSSTHLSKPRWRTLLAMGVFLLFYCGSFQLSTFAQAVAEQRIDRATPVRVADASCASCHGAITKSYLATPMANASGLAIDRFEGVEFLHQASGVTYSFLNKPDGPFFTFHEKGSAKSYPQRSLQYFLGSGHLGLTYLYSVNDYLFETPIAYYASHGLDMKPGLESLTTAAPALPVQSECLRCHMSAVHKSDPGTLDRYSGLPFAHVGITCESCHGDTDAHVNTGGKSSLISIAKLSPDKRDSICISCHLEGDVSVDRAGRSMLDFRPGDSISEFRSYFIYEKHDAAARGVSEVEQFNQSMCKRSSGPGMSCTTCHDPHFSPTQQERIQFYRAKCLSCHTGEKFRKDHHPDNPDCMSCHMPRTGAQNTPHVSWTDHRILKLLPNGLGLNDIVTDTTLRPVFSPSSTDRDLAIAYYREVLEGNTGLASRAYDHLAALKKQLDGDRDALDALGVLSAQRGELAQATDLFKQVLDIDKDNLIASTNLGTLMAKAGNYKQAIELWSSISESNQDLIELTENLARLKCAMGDVVGARQSLLRAVEYSPGSADLQHMLDNLQSCKQN